MELLRESGDERARHWMSQMVRMAWANGAYRLYANLPRGAWNPSLFTGAAGIGYTLLRFCDDTLPNVLLWD